MPTRTDIRRSAVAPAFRRLPLRSVLVSTVVAATLIGCARAAEVGAPVPTGAVYPGATWEGVGDPEAAGWSAEGLARVRDKLSTMSTTGMMAVVGGRMLFEYGDVEVVSYLASVRKSVLSMLYGIYEERGAIDLDDTLDELGIDDIGGLTPQEKQATVRHLLMARSGVYHEASNSGDDLARAPPRGSQRPGEYYLYSNWDFNALGTIFEQETGKNIYDAVGEHIAVPLGFQDWDRSIHERSGDTTRSVHRAYHMNFSTRDMARIGYLMLREGRWQGRQIVPEAWVEESTSALTPRSEMNPPQRRNGAFGYGYLWWVFDNPDLPDAFDGAYTGLGAVGQHILVMPALDLVVAHKTRPGQGRSVSHGQFLEVMALLVQAYCGQSCDDESAAFSTASKSARPAMALPRAPTKPENGRTPARPRRAARGRHGLLGLEFHSPDDELRRTILERMIFQREPNVDKRHQVRLALPRGNDRGVAQINHIDAAAVY
jgi:CubicO group peptidase (beta-lactamase class C family)